MIGTSKSTKVKISNILDSQILDFILEENPDFKDFLNQYYISEEHEFGSTYLSDNLTSLKDISNTSNNILNVSIPNILAADPSRSYDSSINSFDDEIPVTTTTGYPDQYGLFKIDNEIITYTGKTPTSFTGCVRGFSAISSIEKSEYLTFSDTDSVEHLTNLQINVDTDGNRIVEEYVVTVESKDETHPYWQSEYTDGVSPNGYLLDGNQAPPLILLPGHTYKFNQSDISNNLHPIKFYLEADKTTSYGSEIIDGERKPANGVIYYADGIQDKVDDYYSSFSTASVRYIQITVDYGTPTVLYYMCTNHGYMGNAAQVNQDGGRPIINLSSIFVNEFYRKHKSQFLPGFEKRNFVNQINIENILTRAKDFYRSKGTDASLEILFKILFGKSVVIEKPFENTISSSDSEWLVTDNMIVDAIEGNPLNLISTKIFQGTFDNPTAYGTISNIQEVFLGSKKYYKLSFDKSAHFGTFDIGTKTKITEKSPDNSSTINVDSTIGFENAGSFIYKYLDEFFVASYTSKSENQFFGCTGIVDAGLEENTDIIDNTLIFGYEDNDSEKVCTMRITGTISKPSENVSNSKYASVGESIKVNYLGEKASGPKFDTWIYNNSTSLDIKGLDGTFNEENKTNIFTTKNKNHFLYRGCKVDVLENKNGVFSLIEFEDGSKSDNVEIQSINESNDPISFTLFKNGLTYKETPQGETVIRYLLKNTGIYRIKKKLAYVNSALDELPPNLLGNIQNTYIDDIGNTYVSFTGYPSYNIQTTNRSVLIPFAKNLDNFEPNVIKTTFDLPNGLSHSFLTGEEVLFEQSGTETTTVTHETTNGKELSRKVTTREIGIRNPEGIGIQSGRYFVSIEPGALKLSLTLDELRNNNFIQYTIPDTTDITTYVGIATFEANDINNFSSDVGYFDDYYGQQTGAYIKTSGTGQGSSGGFLFYDDSGNPTSYLYIGGGPIALAQNSSRRVILKKLDARNFSKLKIYAIVGNDDNGGEHPDANDERLDLNYQISDDETEKIQLDNENFVNIGTIIPILTNNSNAPVNTPTQAGDYNDGFLKVFEIDIPEEARKENVFFILEQPDFTGVGFDHYGIQKFEFVDTVKITTNVVGDANCLFTPSSLAGSTLTNQNNFKRILKTPEFRESDSEIIGPIGVQLNGVELYSPILNDFISYGQIDDVVIKNKGKNYDVVNPPDIIVNNTNGSGAKLHGHFSGNISEIIVTNPGFNYDDTPQVSVTGGNIEASGKTVVGQAHMRGFIHSYSFNDVDNIDTSGITNNRIYQSIDRETNSIIFNKFDNGEEVIYTTTGEPINIDDAQVGFTTTMLTSGATYFIRKNSDESISLTITKKDAIEGTNIIDFTDFGTNVHTLTSKKIRKIIDRISVLDTESNFKNRKVIVDSNVYPPSGKKKILNTFSGVNISSNYVFAKNHGFSEGDFIEYKCSSFENRIVGLNTITQYRVNKISNDKFKLIDIGPVKETNHAIGFSLSRSLRLSSHTYTDGATSWQQVDDASTNNGFVGIQLRNLIIGSKYKISLTVDNNAATDGSNFEHRVLSQRKESTKTIFSDWNGTKTGVLTGEFIALTENEDELIFYANGITVNVSDFKVELLENTNSRNYNKKIYTDLNSIGVGSHTFKYHDIVVNIKGTSSVGLSTSKIPSYYNATGYPVISGSLDNVYVQNGGVGYGSSNITNYLQTPRVELETGKSGELRVSGISDGEIKSIGIAIGGDGYSSPPTLNVVSIGQTSGKFARLRAIVSNGKIVDVDIIDGGKDYVDNETVINIIPTGSEAILEANVHKWYLNAKSRFEDLLNEETYRETTQISSEIKYENKLIAFYAGVEYRKSLDDNIDIDTNQEITPPKSHSPIVGWAYDGNPIYGPYGYVDPISAGGQVKKIQSSYELKKINDISLRPDKDAGYFVEDYIYTGNKDLDQFNGRFGATPDFPNGTYAYFTTNTVSTSNFPYTTFMHRNKTDSVNYNIEHKQTDNYIDSGRYKRNVSPLGLNEKNRFYSPLSESLESNTKLKVTSCLPGKIKGVTTFESGKDYKVNDIINFNDSFVDAVVSEISGKEIKKVEEIESTVDNLNFTIKDNIVTASNNSLHNFSNNDVVEILGISSSSYNKIQGFHKIGVNTTTTFVSVAIANTSTTGVSTFIKLDASTNSGDFNVDDTIQINSERLLITGLDKINNQYAVLRMRDNSDGSAHNIDATVTKLEKTFTYKISGKKIKNVKNVNEEKIAYVNVTNSVGIGTSYSSVEVGRVGNNPGIGTIYKSIPPRAIFIPNHNFKNGDKVSLVSIGGTIIASPYDSLNPYFDLSTFNPLYCVKINNNYIGLSTQRKDFLTSYVYYKEVEVDNESFGKDIQIKTNENALTGSAKRINGLITLGTSHNISVNDKITLDISPNITERIKDVKFNSDIGCLTIGAGTTTDVGIESTLSTIKINNHGLKTGDGVVYDIGIGLTPARGLLVNKIYYAIKISDDTIKLAETYKKAIKSNYQSIGISTSGVDDTIHHNLSKVNPKIEIAKGNNLEIDLSDTSFDDLNVSFYEDINFKNKIISKSENKIGSPYIQQIGVVGSGPSANQLDNARIVILTENLPLDKFYYKIENDNSLNDFVNTDIQNYSLIEIVKSKFNQTHVVTGVGDKTITFNSQVGSAETTSYSSYEISGFSTATYSTDSKNDQGSISKINIINFGKNTNITPSVTSVGTTTGLNAVFSILSDDIAKIEDTEVTNQGWEFPKNKSLKPKANTYAILDLKNTLTLKSIGVSTGGRNYTTPPKVIGVGNDNIITKSFIDGSSVSNVDIISNDSGLQEDLKIVPTFNSNGVNVINAESSDMSVGQILKLELKAPLGGFTSGVPFSVGDKVFVENVLTKLIPEGNIGAGTTTLASYNSSAYDYNFFEVIEVSNATASANPYIKYSIAGLSTTIAGNYDPRFQFGRVIKADDLSVFKPEFKIVEYVSGEVIKIKDPITGRQKATAIVSENGWDPQSRTLKITDIDGTFDSEDEILGLVNNHKSNISDYNTYEFDLDVDVFAESLGFWKSDKNKPNFNYERLHDNDYYQRFSYSLRGEVDYNTWKGAVNSLNHVSGYKNFAQYEVITDSFVGISTKPESIVDFKVEISSSASVHEQFDYDLVSEIETLDTRISREVQFASKKLTDYIECRTNKVLLLDDISRQFTGLTTETGQLVGLTTFSIKSDGKDILHHVFDPANLSIGSSTINIVDHSFTDGEEIEYSPSTGTSIGIMEAVAPGIAATDILPSKLFVYVVNSNEIALNIRSSESAVGVSVTFANLGSGNSHTLSVNSREASLRSLITIDNIIQSPLGKKLTILELSSDQGGRTGSVGIGSTQIFLKDISKISGNSLLKINDEILYTGLVGIGSTNSVNVTRGYMGTVASEHSVGAGVSELYGNYRISKGNIYFSDAPYGTVGIGTLSGSKIEIDENGNEIVKPITNAMSTRSTFTGRVFFRKNDIVEGRPGSMNNIIDDISDNFDGTTKLFDMKENSAILPVGVSSYSGSILINNIFQKPFFGDVGSIGESDYIVQSPIGGGTTIQFIANPSSSIDTSDIPRGGRINEFSVDVGSGYQVPTRALAYANIGAGGTIASVSISTHGQGYISSPRVSIGVSYANYVHKFIKSLPNSIDLGSNNYKTPTFAEYDSFTGDLLLVIPNHGLTDSNTIQIVDNSLFFTCSRDGYEKEKSYPRTTDPVSGIQTSIISATTNTIIVNVGAGAGVGAAFTSVVSAAGTITAINVVNPGTGYTATKDEPFIVIDEPTPYKDIPLLGGNGSDAKMDVVVGTGGSIIDFKISDRGTGYKINDTLVLHGLPVQSGVSTTPFSIEVKSKYQDKFSGATFGELIELDDFSQFFNGFRRSFLLTRTITDKEYFSIIAQEGSGIILENNLLVFINDVLQKPGIDYEFEGGTRFNFTEAPRAGSKFKMYFFTGSSADVIKVDVDETIKPGDILTLDQFDEDKNGTNEYPTQDPRVIYELTSAKVVETQTYTGNGISADEGYLRPVRWKKQTSDKIIDGEKIQKNRNLNTSQMYPATNIIAPVSSTDRTLNVKDVVSLGGIDNLSATQNIIKIFNQIETKVAKATATIDSTTKKVTQITIDDGGSGYTRAPRVAIQPPTNASSVTGFGAEAELVDNRATGGATIDGNGVVTGIAITNPGDGYTFTPKVIIEQEPTFSEEFDKISYFGDRGMIIGINTAENGSNSGVSTSSPALTFDIFPTQTLPFSPQRENSKTGIVTGQYIVIQGTSFVTPDGIVSIGTHTSKIVSVGNSFADNVYQVGHYEDIGVGSTIRRITCNINTALSGIDTTSTPYNGTSGGHFIGNYSWGTITMAGNRSGNAYPFYNQNGLAGIETSAHISRTLQLKQVY